MGLAGGLVAFAMLGNKPKTIYTTVSIEKKDIIQTVSETGTIKSANEIKLSFLNSGKIEKINFNVGDKILKDNIIAGLDCSDLYIRKEESKANVDVARANHNKLLAGATKEDINISKAGLQQAKTAYEAAEKELEKNNFPYMLVSRNIEGLDKNCIIVDDVAGGIMATEYLIKLGYRKIAHITGPLKVRGSINRLEGYKLALEKHQIEYKEELVEEGDFRIKGGYQAMKKFLKLSKPPTAIFAANDLLALGAMQVIQKKKYHIPKDFCIIGFDDIRLASFVYPPLTTIRQPMLEMGALAVKMLLKIIEEGEFNQKKEVLEPKLIIRESCRKINRK